MLWGKMVAQMSAALLSTLGTIGPYELIHPLGAGGMAETFLAIKRGPAGFEQKVCVKRILAGYTADTTFVELFLDEARLLAAMQCANIVQVYDFGESNNTYYMALELVDGGDLQAILRWLEQSGQQLSSQAALWIAGQLLRALHYAHTLEQGGQPLNIVHRDISPSNVLVSRAGEVKLTDFGIAKSSKRSHKTRTGQTKGKLAYMSPEQVQGKPLDARSDLFSTGILLYELLTRVHPFDAPTDLEMLHNIMGGVRRPLAALAPDQPQALIDLVDAMLAPPIEARPASAAEALERLGSVPTSMNAQEDLARVVRAYREAKPLPTVGPGSDPRSGVRVGASSSPFEVRSGQTVALPLPAEPSYPDLQAQRPQRAALWVSLALAVLGGAAAAAYVLRSDESPEAPDAQSEVVDIQGSGSPAPGQEVEARQDPERPPKTESANTGSERAIGTPAEPTRPARGEEVILNQPERDTAEARKRGPSGEPTEAEKRSSSSPTRRHGDRRQSSAGGASSAENQGKTATGGTSPTTSSSPRSARPSSAPGRTGAEISADEF